MADATISHVRGAIRRVWAADGTHERPRGRPHDPSAARAQPLTDAASIGEHLSPRPRAAGSRSGRTIS